MNGASGHFCAHVGETGPGEPSEDGEMPEMTPPSRHRIRNSSQGGLRPSMLHLGHEDSPQIEYLRMSEKETFCFFKT